MDETASSLHIRRQSYYYKRNTETVLTVLNVTSESTFSRYRPQVDEMYLYVSKSKQGDSIFTNIQSEFIRPDEFTIALLCSSILKHTSG